jgi:hypothetical protein
MTVEYKDSKRITALSTDWTADVTSNITWSTTGKVGWDISGTTISRTGSAGWSTSKIQSTDTFTVGDGAFMIEFSGIANDLNSTMLGLNKGTLGYHYGGGSPQNNCDFAIYVAGGSRVEVYESGTKNYDSGGSRNANDKFRIEVSNSGVVKYYLQEGGTGSFDLKHTSSSTASGTYFIQANAYASTSEVTVHSKTVATAVAKPSNVQDNSLLVEKDTARRYWFDAESTSNVTWNDSTDVGCSISGNTITKTASNSWTSGIGQTDQQISVSNGGTITMTSNATNSFIGLSNVTSLNQQAKTWFDIKFGFSDEEIIENGAQITPDSAFTRQASDTMKITVSSSGLVKYYINDVLKHTSTITASGSYFGIFAAYTQNENMTATTTTPATWTMQPTYSTNFLNSSGWVTSNGSKFGYNGNSIDILNSNAYESVYYDLESVSDTKWLCRFKVTLTTAGSQSLGFCYFYVGSLNGNANQTNDGLGFYFYDNANNTYALADNGNRPDQTTVTGALGISPSTTTYYAEMKRTSAEEFVVKLYDNDSYSYGQLGSTATLSISSGITGLRYFKIMGYSTTGGLVGTFDDFEFYNGVSTIN